MTDASVYVTGQNLFYITGYEGTSPEPAVSKNMVVVLIMDVILLQELYYLVYLFHFNQQDSL